MPRFRESFKRGFRKITDRRPKQLDIPPAAPSANNTPNNSSATNNDHVPQEQSRDSVPLTSPTSPIVPSASITPEDSAVTGSDHVQQEQSRDDLSATSTAAKSLWDRAYDALAKENPDLVKQYDELLEKEEQMANSVPNEMTPLMRPAPHGRDIRFDRSPRQVQLDTVIQSGLRRMEDNKTTFKIAGREVVLADQITKAANFLLWGREFIGSAVKDSPEASLVWSGVSLILSLLTNPTTAAEANQCGFVYVTSRLRYYVALEPMVRRLGQNTSVDEALVSAANDHIVDLYQAILDLQLSSVLRFYQSRLKTYVRDIVPLKDWDQTLLDIKTLEETVNTALGQINDLAARERLELLNRTSEETRAIMEDCLSVAKEQLTVSKKQLTVTEKHLTVSEKHLVAQEDVQRERLLVEQRREQRKCLQAFCLTRKGSGVTYEWYKGRVVSRVEGTCKWFLQHENYQKWLSQESGPLLVSADPGCGKSVLAKYLVDHELAQQSATICYFFFKDQDQNTPRQALCALLHQLFRQKSALIQHAMKLYNELEATLVEFEASLWTILRDALRDPQAGPVIFVIDALDECDELQFESFITSLKDIFHDQQMANSKFKVLMTSRPYDQVVRKFRSLQDDFPRIHIPGEEEFEAISQEINTVIQHRVEQLAQEHWLSDKIKSTLSSKLLAIEHRTYLWVFLVFDYLDRGFKTTEDGIDAAIQELPESVNQAYDQILNRSHDTKTVKTIKKALSIILAARQPLTLSEMNIAMNLEGPSGGRTIYDLDLEQDSAFKIRLRRLCGLFVNVHHDRIYFLHQTAREFLIQSSAPTTVSSDLQWHRSITTRHAHSVLAEICMLYLDRLNSTHTDSFREGDHHCALVDYSVKYWGGHCRQAEFEKDSAMVDLASGLCSPDLTSCSQWASIASVRYHIRPGSSAYVWVASRLGLTAVTELLLSNGADIEAKDSRGRTALFLAANAGHEAVAHLLLDKGADVEARDNRGWTALMAATSSWIHAAKSDPERFRRMLLDDGANIEAGGDVDLTELFLAAKTSHEAFRRLLINTVADVEVKGDDGWTASTLAARSGHEAVVRLLLGKGAEVQAKQNYGWTALMLAAADGHEAVVRLLLDKGADIEAKTDNGATPLLVAAAKGHEAVTRLLLDEGADVDAENNNGWTALMLAAESGHEAVVRLLLDKGADVDAENNNGATALMLATNSGHEAVVRLLLDKGANIEAKKNDGVTALMLAAAYCHEAVTRLLLDKGADVDAENNNGWTALMLAAESGHEAVVRLLLGKGADVQAKQNDGWTALMLAAANGHEAVVRLLLDKGADIEAKKDNGATPLLVATESGHEAVVRLLLDKGADVDAENNNGATALLVAARSGHEAVARLLLDKGADVDAENNNGWTALMLAAESVHEAVVRLLLGKGADVQAKQNDGWTALMLAAANGHEAVVRLLLDKGADIEAKKDNGATPLLVAAANGHEAVTRLLLDKGADVDAENNNGATALMLAANSGHEAVVRLLLDTGADVEAKKDDGWTALMLAAANGHEAVVRLLFEKGADVEAKKDDGWTALMLAARYGYEAVVRLLLDNGADVEAKDDDGWAALMVAASSGHEAVARLLLDSGADVEAKDNKGWTALRHVTENTTRLPLDNGTQAEATDVEGSTPSMLTAKNNYESVRQLLLEKAVVRVD